jgi:transposase-like protein
MARKATVNREIVLQMLREGKTSQSIADQFGVSRQAIDLYRKQFHKDGQLAITQGAVPATPIFETRSVLTTPTPLPARTSAISNLSLDQMVDIIIEAFDAMKRIPEMEAELGKIRRNYEQALKEIEELKLKEQKRKEQEARWIHAQQPGIITNQ